MARKKPQEEGGGPNWLDTYADMVTLLLTFFVLLFSISSVDAQKWEILVRSFSGEMDSDSQFVITDEEKEPDDGINAGQEDLLPDQLVKNPEDVKQFDDLYKYLQNYIQENDLESDISLYNGDGYTFIIFRNNIFFDGDSSILKQEGKGIDYKQVEQDELCHNCPFGRDMDEMYLDLGAAGADHGVDHDRYG